MRLLHRFGYYLGGFAIGLIILAFFFSGKKTSCSYFPQARVLKNLRSKPYTLSPQAQESLKLYSLDTITINRLLHLGEVDFSKSETRKEPCGLYFLEGDTEGGLSFQMRLDNCEKTVVIQDIKKIR